MSIQTWTALAFAAAFVVGAIRAARDGRAVPGLRIGLQFVVAALLWLCLVPPSTRQPFRSDELVVLTPGATPAQLSGLHASTDVIALPGVDAVRTIERVPDLATALRRHPDVRRLRVVGAGLSLRDRDAARGLVATFEAVPLPHGIVELDAPRRVLAGNAWRVGGRVEGVAAARVELRDPADALVATATADAHGRFALETFAKDEGSATFALRVQDAGGARIDEATLALDVQRGEPLSLLLLAGAPDAELKYLRRWAVDAGLRLDSRVGLSEGIALTEGMPALDVDALARADVAIVDERAWAALAPTQKKALLDAVDHGLGLLLRVTGTPAPAVMTEWAALGFRMTVAADATTTVRFDRASAPMGSGPVFTRHPLDVQAPDSAALLRDDAGVPVALWRAQSRGRIGLWWLADAWRLALSGDRARYASTWSATLATLARARGDFAPQIPRDLHVDERALLCGVAEDDRVEAADGTSMALLVDADSGCAAWWPRRAGRHTLVSAGKRWALDVSATNAASPLSIAMRQQATRALLVSEPGAAAGSVRVVPLPRWPFFLAWLTACALLWALERRVAHEPSASR